MRPADLEVAHAVGVKNILQGRVVDRSAEGLAVRVGDVDLNTPVYPIEIGASVCLCVRPERVLFQRKDLPPRGRINQLECHIVGEESDGLNCTVFLKTVPGLGSTKGPGDLKVDLPVYVYERLELAHERDWFVYIPPGAIHVVAGPAEK
jgi:hypothetical protein